LSLREIRDSVIPIDEIARVNGIEQLDEVEELNLVLEHYAISYGFVGDTETVTRESMDTIGLIPRT
jgi:[phosphatase 2A protein]-leucine-carboxy methyltransferase